MISILTNKVGAINCMEAFTHLRAMNVSIADTELPFAGEKFDEPVVLKNRLEVILFISFLDDIIKEELN